MTREERVAKIRGGRWIRYPLADRIAAKLEELLLLPKTHRMPNLLPTCLSSAKPTTVRR
jgi:hypothetical protein